MKATMGEPKDIITINFHPNGEIVYLGDEAPRPHVYIWNIISGQIETTLTKGLMDGIASIELSPKENLLAVTCLNKARNVVIYDCTQNYAVHTIYKLGEPGQCFMDLVWTGDEELCFCGIKYFMTQKVEPSSQIKTLLPTQNFEKILICSLRCPDGTVVFGTKNGELEAWRDGKFVSSVDAHRGQLEALTLTENTKGSKKNSKSISSWLPPEGFILLSGGKDGKLVVYDSKLEIWEKYDLYPLIPNCQDAHIRALDYNEKKEALAVGLISGEIYEIPFG